MKKVNIRKIKRAPKIKIGTKITIGPKRKPAIVISLHT